MPSTNIQILLGNLGKDIELKQAPKGNMMASFTLATDDGHYDNENGEWKENVNCRSSAVAAEPQP